MSILAGAIDVHLHTSPDVVPRRYTDLEAAALARNAGMRAIVLKCHHESTVGRAATAAAATGFSVYGGLVLNPWCSGGVDLDSVSAALELGAKVIWLATLASSAHWAYYGTGPGDPEPDSRALAEVCEVVGRRDAVVATGHATPALVRRVAEAASGTAAHVLVTHADFVIPDLGAEEQAELAATHPHIWFERCAYICAPGTPEPRPLSRIAQAIVATGGPDRNVLSSDLGQPELPPYPDGLAAFAEGLVAEGLPERDIRQMLTDEPARLLSL